MTKTTNQIGQSAIILYGLTSIGKPKAGLFKGTEVTPARKAATSLNLQTFDISDQPGRSLATKIPVGRIQGHGEAIVPFVPKHLYEAIENLARPKPTNENGEKSDSQSKGPGRPRLPANWDDIKVGDCVLAQDADPKDGWWRAKVVEKSGDLLRLRWPRSERGRPFQKHRFTVGLLCPSDRVGAEQPEPRKPSGSLAIRFPKDWAAIAVDQIVLAKEDGPCEQWWEAKTIKLDKDVFTLQWRDRPDLPPIERPRSCLGLMHPAPKSR